MVKRSGVTEPFTRDKVVAGVRKACKGRPVAEDDLARLAQQVEEALRAERLGRGRRPTRSALAILGPLRELDEVAYLRFASVYRAFESADGLRGGDRRCCDAERACTPAPTGRARSPAGLTPDRPARSGEAARRAHQPSHRVTGTATTAPRSTTSTQPTTAHRATATRTQARATIDARPETRHDGRRVTAHRQARGRKGLKIERVFTTEGVHPYDEVTWERRDVVQTNWKTGEAVFEQRGVEFPDFW